MITIIAAVSEDGFIGKDGDIPWHLPSDMREFKETTVGHTVVMGRKTWESIPDKFRPLPERRNIVLSRQATFEAPGAEVRSCVENVLTLAEDASEKIFIMGGEEVYRQFLPFAERAIITRVQTEVGDGDARFPGFPDDKWNLVAHKEVEVTEEDEHPFNIDVYSPNLPYIELANVRTPEQLRTMRQIRERDHCPFCRENLPLYHHKPITWEGEFWILTDNQWPYPGKNVHKLVILKEHAKNVSELPDGAGDELVRIIEKVQKEEEVNGGGLGWRFGNPLLSGASVKHLHAQIISPQPGKSTAIYVGIGEV